MVASCDNSSAVMETPKQDQEISKIDGNPIINLKETEFYHGNFFNNLRDKLAKNEGSTIVRALNELNNKTKELSSLVPVKELSKYALNKEKTPEIGSTHFRVTDSDGESEDFVLSLRRYYKNTAKVAHKSRSQLKSSTTYLALSPDRFYLKDDENGLEQWPVTFPAISLDDPTDKIKVTFNADGLVSSSVSQNSKDKSILSSGELDLVFADATPVVQPSYVLPCDPGCGSGGSGTLRENDNTRGDDPRTPDMPGLYPPERTYFVVHSIKLASEGDGDGAAELQMFVQKSDNYDVQNMPLKYRYRFDNAFRVDPTCNCSIPRNNTNIYGADRHVYEVPDINSSGIEYDFVIRWVSPIGTSDWYSHYVGFFPLIDLSSHEGNWRLVMSDDDKDYQDFSRRRQTNFYPEIDTHNMSNGNYSLTNTGFTVESKTYGSSDDPRLGSGVRRITINNVQSQMVGGQVVAQTLVGGNQFKYVFGLETYDPVQI